jgi:hypothetical protein
MRRWDRRGVELYPIDPRVPAFSDWPAAGISGRIGKGPHTGEPVLARRLELKWKTAETAYILWIPEEILEGPDEGFMIESDSIDAFHTDGTGGLVDYITTGLGIEWSVDPQDFVNAEAFWPASKHWKASKRRRTR